MRLTGLSVRERTSASVFLDHGCIPNRVEVGVLASERDINGVAADIESLIVQWLVDITHKLSWRKYVSNLSPTTTTA